MTASDEHHDMWPRILPFAAFMAFIALSSFLDLIVSADQAATVELWTYPIKTLLVGGLLVFFWSRYGELKQPVVANWQEGLVVLGVGLIVYVLWVRMDWPWALQGEMTEYTPFDHGPAIGAALAAFRIFGASVVVPVMEELFWRSFLIRWIINTDYHLVPIGTYTAASFAITVALFGAEHNLWLAGMMAGACYNGLLYYTRRLWPCILAHAITNFALGVHVLLTGEWQWW